MKTLKIFVFIFTLVLSIVLFSSCNDQTGSTQGDDTTTTTEAADVTTTTENVGNADPSTCTHSYETVSYTRAFALKDGAKTEKCSACGNEKSEVLPATKSLKMLVLGNSFTIDPTWHLWGICNDAGIEEVVIGSLFIGSCVLDQHWDYITMDLSNCAYYKNTTGDWVQSYNYTVERALQDEEWDVIAIGHSSSVGGLPETYTNLNNIVEFMKQFRPEATFFFQSPWAFQKDSTRASFANYDWDQMKMYRMITDTVEELAGKNEYFYDTIPSGTAIQNLRTSYVGDTLTRDGYHMSYGLGRYTIALAWYSIITGGSIENITWVPAKYPEVANDLPAAKEAVNNALANRFEITQSTYTKKP